VALQTSSSRRSCGRDPGGAAGELLRLERLRVGDEAAFAELVDRYAAAMLHVALMYVPSRAVAEEVVQETWLSLLEGLERFEGRSSLHTWLFCILVNRARTRGTEGPEPAVDVARSPPAAGGSGPGHWAAPPERSDESPERCLQSTETLRVVHPIQRSCDA